MWKRSAYALALLGVFSISCGGKTVQAPAPDSHLEVYVHWQDQPLADRKLEILELNAAQTTNAEGLAEFTLPAGTFTLRAYVNSGGPPL